MRCALIYCRFAAKIRGVLVATYLSRNNRRGFCPVVRTKSNPAQRFTAFQCFALRCALIFAALRQKSGVFSLLCLCQELTAGALPRRSILGGGGGNRTPVRKPFCQGVSGCSRIFKIPRNPTKTGVLRLRVSFLCVTAPKANRPFTFIADRRLHPRSRYSGARRAAPQDRITASSGESSFICV